MTDLPAIDVRAVTKSYRGKQALNGATFAVRAGSVTGLLGPNGSGKTTALRVILGLERADSGTAHVLGGRYAELPRPMHQVGALLSAAWVHPERSARDHLRWIAAAAGLPEKSVSTALATVGLSEVAGQPAGGFSLGMRQRLGIATTVLGDPEVVIYDEPLNGLDQEGVVWIRDFFRNQARIGRTVLVSSHLLDEVQQTVTDVIVLGQGRTMFSGSLEDLLGRRAPTVEAVVRLEGDSLQRMRELVSDQGWAAEEGGDEGDQAVFTIVDVPLGVVAGETARCGIPLRSIHEGGSLVDAYAQLTASEHQFTGVRQEV